MKAADIDGDGDPDLLVGNGGEANSLFINQGGFEFRKVTTGDFVADYSGVREL
eukprot:SAG31_NODE_8870_length_1370_cov_1.293470_1_plen_52_part_10